MINVKVTRVGASERGQRTSFNRANGISDIEHVAIGNRAGRRQRSQGSWREHGAVRVINVKLRGSSDGVWATTEFQNSLL